jgi:hypothetical protein
MQDDGNLVLYDSLSSAIWASGTNTPTYSQYNPIPQQNQYAPPPAPYNPAPSYNPAPAPFQPSYQPAPTYGVRDKLHASQVLNQNEFIKAPGFEFYARVQTDGNFVLYTSNSFESKHAIWSSNTYGKGTAPYQLRMQDDGNLVLYDAYQKPIWASDTWNKGSKPHHLVQQDDGNLVLYDANRTPTWSSNTYGKTAPPSYAPPPTYPPPTYPPNNYAPPPTYPPNNYAPPPTYPPPNNYAPPSNSYAPPPVNIYVQPTPTYRDKLHSGYQGVLLQNEFIKSPYKEYYARVQTDGNFVLYKTSDFRSHNAIWASNTGNVGQGPFQL